MKLFIDTTLEHLTVALYDQKNILIDFYSQEVKHKSDELHKDVTSLLNNNNVDFNHISDFYVTQGPGSFMGVRAGLIYVRTLKQINNSLNVWIANSFVFINQSKELFINASKSESFRGIMKNGKWEIEVIDKKEPTKINYPETLKDASFLNSFTLIKSLDEMKPLYFKDPRIGGK